MTEQDWLSSEDPAKMLDWLGGSNPLRGQCPITFSDRKRRLFACAYFRALPARHGEWHELLAAIGWGEKVADGLPYAQVPPAGLGWQPCSATGAACASWVITDVDGDPEARKGAAALLREVAGNPLRPVTLPKGPPLPPRKCGCGRGRHEHRRQRHTFCAVCDGKGTVCDPGPCPWLTPTVLSLAQAAYDERLPGGTLDPFRLALLTDALEEARCPSEENCGECPVLQKAKVNAAGYYDRDMVQEVIAWGKAKKACGCKGTGLRPNPILAHLRSPGPHVRGCWALDLILGKE